jgi:hypothetical protein
VAKKAGRKSTRKDDDPARTANNFLRPAAGLYYYVETDPELNPEGFKPWSSPVPARKKRAPRQNTKVGRIVNVLRGMEKEGIHRDVLLAMKNNKLLAKVQKRKPGCPDADRKTLARALSKMDR